MVVQWSPIKSRSRSSSILATPPTRRVKARRERAFSFPFRLFLKDDGADAGWLQPLVEALVVLLTGSHKQ